MTEDIDFKGRATPELAVASGDRAGGPEGRARAIGLIDAYPTKRPAPSPARAS